MEGAIRHEIAKRFDEDPAFYTSFTERLEQIIRDRKAKRIDAAKQLELLRGLRDELKGKGAAARQAGISETAFAIYGVLAEARRWKTAETTSPYGKLDEATKKLASSLEELLEPHVCIVDWAKKDDVQREMRRTIKRQLRAESYEPAKVDEVAEGIVELMKRRRG